MSTAHVSVVDGKVMEIDAAVIPVQKMTSEERDALVEEIWAAVEIIQITAKVRTLSKVHVRWLVEARRCSPRETVRVWGGWVPKSYGWKAEASTAHIMADGTWKVARTHAPRRIHGGNADLVESGPNVIEVDVETIRDEGALPF